MLRRCVGLLLVDLLCCCVGVVLVCWLVDLPVNWFVNVLFVALCLLCCRFVSVLFPCVVDVLMC